VLAVVPVGGIKEFTVIKIDSLSNNSFSGKYPCSCIKQYCEIAKDMHKKTGVVITDRLLASYFLTFPFHAHQCLPEARLYKHEDFDLVDFNLRNKRGIEKIGKETVEKESKKNLDLLYKSIEKKNYYRLFFAISLVIIVAVLFCFIFYLLW
jgi:hypothetical protein